MRPKTIIQELEDALNPLVESGLKIKGIVLHEQEFERFCKENKQDTELITWFMTPTTRFDISCAKPQEYPLNDTITKTN